MSRFVLHPNGNMIRHVCVNSLIFEFSVPLDKWSNRISNSVTYWIRKKKEGKSPKFRYGTVTEIEKIPEQEITAYRCDACKKSYKSYSGFYKHRDKCSSQYNDVSEHHITMIENEMGNIRGVTGGTIIGTQNVTHAETFNNQINIQIRDFGKENPRWLTAKLIDQVIRDIPSAIPKLMEKKHFNSDFPENRNIKIDTKREINNHLQVKSSGRWKLYRTKPIFFQMLDSIHDIISDALTEDEEELIEENNTLHKDERTYTYEQIKQFREDSRFIEKMRRIRPIWEKFNDQLQEDDKKHIDDMWEDLKVMILDRQLALEQGFPS
jgi:hypothetical protein